MGAPRITPWMLSRARGCLLGQLSGDALGGLVEFRSAGAIREMYPGGLRDMADGGTWDTIAGQPTDDSELALALARTLVECGRYDAQRVRRAYVAWFESEPFDVGQTTTAGLRGCPLTDSQSNGALMRISPLGIFGAAHRLEHVAEWARQDARITHPHVVCQQANALYVRGIARAIRSGPRPRELWEQVRAWAGEEGVDPVIQDAIARAADASPPGGFQSRSGWVVTAFGNALWQLLHAPSLEEAVVDTVMRGGDTDTNAAVCGALLGAVYGSDAVPQRWVACIERCRPEAGRPGVRRPRPRCYWPSDALELAQKLLHVGAGAREQA